jgi:hypothetical protein
MTTSVDGWPAPPAPPPPPPPPPYPAAAPASGEHGTDRPKRRRPAEPGSSTSAPAQGWGNVWARVRAYWGGDIDSPWSEPPASMAELVRYARAGAWCAEDAVLLRMVGMAYCYLVAIPMSCQLYLRAWIYQRPGRAISFGLLIFVLRLSIGLSVLAVAKYLVV